ncbi:ead/Ea22-like family protein [Salmonella enterica]|nr:ead/Ea22-like family protein [Salmonella enterica]EJD1378520.1 ead/Ea22-like family protein [Salmonella enterica]
MSNIDKRALREEFRFMQVHYSDPADRARQVIYIAAEALLDDLETKEEQRANWFQMAQKLGEDLDAAEKRNAEQREYYEGVIADGSKRIAEQSAIVAAAEKLVRCKGRYHSELNYRALAKLFGVITPDLPPLEHENVHYADAAEVEIAALHQRIAELEARTVNLSKLSVGEVMHMSGFSRDYAEGWCAGNDNAIHEIRAAGIKVNGE